MACGQQKKASIKAELQAAQTNLGRSSAVSVTLHLTDPGGRLRAAMTGGSGSVPPAVADAILAGDLQLTVAAADGRTLDQLSGLRSRPVGEQLKAANLAFVVHAGHGSLFELRIVGGSLYARVDDALLSRLAGHPVLGGLFAGAPAALQGLVADVKAGKWLTVPLGTYADQLSKLAPALAGRGSVPPSLPPGLGSSLMSAVRPYISVTDAGNDSHRRVLDVRVQLKPALAAALRTVKSGGTVFPGLGALDGAITSGLRSGTVKGTITLRDSHLSQVTLDLASLRDVAPVHASFPPLAGSALTLDVNDAAAAPQAPTDLSSFDLGKLLSSLLGGLGKIGQAGSLGLLSGSATASGAAVLVPSAPSP